MSSVSPHDRVSAGLVERLRESDIDKLLALCKMHFSVLFDLDADNFDNLFGDSKEETKFGLGFLFRKRKNSRADHLEAAGPLQETFASMERLIRHLHTKENISQEGLFRKPGNMARQKELKERLATPDGLPKGSSSQAFSHYSPHDCACVLKTLLGEMPEPLLTEKLYLAHCKVLELKAVSAQVKAMQLLMVMLPPENRRFLEELLGLLRAVAQTPSSRMTCSSLGTVFSPHILCPRKLTATELQSIAGAIQQTVAIMVEHSKDIFKVPRELVLDITKQLKHDAATGGASDRDGAVMTTLTFTDRVEPTSSDAPDYTQKALAELYEGIHSMPESAKKRKYIRQLNCPQGHGKQVENKQNKHSRSKSVTESIKKHFRKHKRRTSNNEDDCPQSGLQTPGSFDSFMPRATSKVDSTANKVMMMPIRSLREHASFSKGEANGSQPNTSGMIIRPMQVSPSARQTTSRKPMTLLNVSDTCLQL